MQTVSPLTVSDEGGAGFLSHVSMTFINVARARRLPTDATFSTWVGACPIATLLPLLFSQHSSSFICHFFIAALSYKKIEAVFIFDGRFVTETHLPLRPPAGPARP